MIAVIQRVSSSAVRINGSIKDEIGMGIMILLGIEEADDGTDIEWLTRKIVNLRIFNDSKGIMNESVLDQNGEILVISQFTLHASTKKGNSPSYIKAAKPETAIPLYDSFIANLEILMNKKVKSGEFGADMKVSLVNDGPVTIIIDTKDKK